MIEATDALSPRQRTVLVEIDRYLKATGEVCSMNYLARRLNVHRSTIREHINVLHKKGWLRACAPGPPARPLEL